MESKLNLMKSQLLRGGSLDDGPWPCRSARRDRLQPDDTNAVTGFRVCCLPLETPAARSGWKPLRGGSWYFYSGDCRSAYRDTNPPGNRDPDHGFRVCCLPRQSIEMSSMYSLWRMLRGGSWLNHPRLCCSACRVRTGTGYADAYVGFRVACSGAPATEVATMSTIGPAPTFFDSFPPAEYRLGVRNGAIVLQRCCRVDRYNKQKQTLEISWEWRDIPVVNLDGEDN